MSVAGKLRRSVYVLQFLSSLQLGVAFYFNSSYLSEKGFSAQAIGILFAISYALAGLGLIALPRLLQHLGTYRAYVAFAIGGGLLFLGVAAADTANIAAAFLVFAMASSTMLGVPLDLFLETTTADEDKTGLRRGLFISLLNGALLVAQFFALLLLAYGSFSMLYAVSGIALVAIGVLCAIIMRDFRDKPVSQPRWIDAVRLLIALPDMRRIFTMQFLLRFFYAIMVIYTPIYLHETLGIPLEELTLVFAAMLIPFVLLEVPLGRLEDTRWGEREVLLYGTVFIAFSTAMLAFISSGTIAVWAAALFSTRIGAAMLDIGSEGYFFKNVVGSDAGLVSAFRLLYPIAHILGPILGAIFLLFFPLQYIFVGLALVMLLGIPAAGTLKDTR